MAMPIRIGVVGAGPLVGLHHCKAVASCSSSEAELACICDLPSNASVAERFGVPLYTDAEEMALRESLDGVVIAAPTHLHLPLVEKCISGARARRAELGQDSLQLKAILVEKPICEDLCSALRLVDIANAAGIQVLVGHQRRHSVSVQKAREIVTHADFGPLRGLSAEFVLLKPQSYFKPEDARLRWRCEKNKGGPVLINLIHDVDLLRFITRHEVATVFAAISSNARNLEVEDTGAVTVVLSDGAVGTFMFSDASPSPWSYEFTSGENKKYPPIPGTGATDCYRFMGARQSLGFPSLRRYSYGSDVEEAGWDAPLSLHTESVEQENPILLQMQHFVEVCNGNEAPICSGQDGIESLAVIMAVLRSASSGKPESPAELLLEARSLLKISHDGNDSNDADASTATPHSITSVTSARA
eukprot:TRINITY_DN55814_c0_g1_i1.p1 TRINITY_DN55814_c0_g1~~TRINITY_DN55814_c0_g1_i1.p1  ORF type:complete len:416 (+),score=59.71 TRINITY_DN55814_c0_g1_i1:44-1291(+)